MSYTRVNWEDAPSVATPLSASNLNKMDAGIKQNADDIADLQAHTYDTALNGTSTNAPQTKVVKEAIDDAIEEATVLVDPTLSNEGQAADAKATGDAVSEVDEKVGSLAITKTASGNMVTITDGADGMPLRSLSVDITAVQSGSGDPSPENIRPITGFDAVTVARSSVNLLDASHLAEASGWARSTVEGYTELDGVPVYTGTTRGLYVSFGDGYPMTANAFEENTQYTVTLRWRSDASTAHGIKVGFLYTDGTKESYGTSAGSPTWKRQTLTSAEGKTVEGLYFTYNSNYTIMMAGLAVVKASEYDENIVYPSMMQTVTIPLGNTVYGGTLDVMAGKLTVEYIADDMGNLDWTYTTTGTYPYFTASLPAPARNRNIGEYGVICCERYEAIANLQAATFREADYSYKISINSGVSSSYRLIVQDPTITDAETFKSAVTGVKVVTVLAEPTIIDLTPDNLTTLKGLNKIWANSGAISIEYYVDMESGIAEIARETVRIDDTLTNSGEAADAKVTGDAIASVKATQIVASASGAVASFTDGADGVPVRSLAVEFEPIQDLHGQNNPYPAGGGVNLFDESTVTIGNWYSNTGTLSTNAPYACVSADIPATGGETYAIKCYGEIPYSMSVVEFDDNGFLTRSHVSNSQTKTVTTTAGTTKIAVQFAAGGTADTPMTADVLASYQAVFYKGATAPDVYAPYSNICPVNGRDAVTVMRSGVNLISKDIVRGYPDNTAAPHNTKRKFTPNTFVVGMASNNYYNPSAITDFSYENGVLTFTARTSGYGIGLPLIVKGGYQYRFSATLDISCRAMFYDADGNFLGYQGATNATVTAPDDAVCCVFCLFKTSSGTFTVSDIMVTYGSTAQTYVDGNAEYVTFPLGDTVYGGTVDIATGKLTVNRVSVDMGTLAWLRTHSGISTEGGYIFYCTSIEFAHLPIMCSMYPYVGTVNSNAQAYNQGDKTVSQLINATRVYIRDDTYTTVDDLKTALSGQQLVYYLATPLEIDLTPAQLTTLLGNNNIWSDAGDVSVDYVADTKLYIEALTAPDADMVADANITSGHYFMVGNTLYLATANIASGAAITPGVNCNKTNLAEALNAINS